MAGRIEPTPIRTDVATLGDYRSRALLGDQQGAFGNGAGNRGPEEQPLETEAAPSAQPAAPLPPAEPSGTAFDASMAAGRLDTSSPLARQLLMQRKGSWSPPDSDLHLTDRTA
jgi:hypothetical protein